MGLSVREWEIVAKAPVLVFVLVSKADGKISSAERSTLVRKWRTRLHCLRLVDEVNELTTYGWAIDRAIDNVNQLVVKSSDEILRDLERALQLVHQSFEPARCRNFREALADLAQDVARASGGMLGLTDPICAEEREAIEQIDALMQRSSNWLLA